MLTRLGLLALLALLAACGSSARATTSVPGPAARPPGCGPSQARTVAFSRVARAYVQSDVVYGCSVPGRRRFRLGTLLVFRRLHLDGVAVGGRIAAYGMTAFGVDTGGTNVLVRRLTNGVLLASYPATNVFLAESFSSVGSLVVKGDGAVAWIGQSNSVVAHGHGVQVYEAAPRASSPTLLDQGPSIAPGSLRLQGSTLSWRDGDSTRHATLR